MGKLYEENWYQKWQKETFLGKIPEAVPVHPPVEAKWYWYRSKLYWYRCAQNAQNVMIFHI